MIPISTAHASAGADIDVLIVGAGPTGLVLAAQLRSFGTRFRIVDRLHDRTRESRALAVQARSLEILQTLGLGEALVARGSATAQVVMHLDGRPVGRFALAQGGETDTRFPFVLLVSQAETERVVDEHLRGLGVNVERGVELTGFDSGSDYVRCELRHDGGRAEQVRTHYVVGCDGAHSSVRKGAGIPFEGGSYPQEFVLGDVEADGSLEPHAINSFAGNGVAMFFPLGRPTTWRVIAMSPEDVRASRSDAYSRGEQTRPMTRELSLAELQAIVDVPTVGTVRVRDPAWLTRFHLHHRQTAKYRSGRVFLAGDAAHVHSPVGAQGMNTGIQDAWNLGWKLALAARGVASPRLLDSYEAERWPVGRFLLRYTDRIFATFTRAIAGGRVASWVRRRVMPKVLPRVLASSRLRAGAFRFVSELGIRYRRSPIVLEGRPRLSAGPRAGDRLPDARVVLDGRRVWLQEAIVGARHVLILCGPAKSWDCAAVERLRARHADLLALRFLTREANPGELVDEAGSTLLRLGVRDAGQYLVRPDGYIAFRCAGRDLAGLERYLREVFG